MAPAKKKVAVTGAGSAPSTRILRQRGIGEFVGGKRNVSGGNDNLGVTGGNKKVKVEDDATGEGTAVLGGQLGGGNFADVMVKEEMGAEGGEGTAVKKESPGTTPGIIQPTADSNTDPQKPYILRKFYPPEMTNARAQDYIQDRRQRPIETLNIALKETAAQRKATKVGDSVLHWFRADLRVSDNSALCMASLKAREKNGKPANVVCLYVISPQDWDAHVTSPAQIDFIFRNLGTLKQSLRELNIPLHIMVVEHRRNIPDEILAFAQRIGAKHMIANMCYEVDELRQDAKVVRAALKKGINFEVVQDTCVVKPGDLSTKTGGKQFAVFTPWFKAWVAHTLANPQVLTERAKPTENPENALETFKDLFDQPIPKNPRRKDLDEKTLAVLEERFPHGEDAADKRLMVFIEKQMRKYKIQRDMPGIDGVSALSPYLAIGVISSRKCIREARKANKNQLIGNSDGHSHWISEVGWREFYKHILVNWPHVCMNKPFKPEYTNIRWNYNPDHFKAWIEGKTGYPLVDAAMRHLAAEKWLPNRCRMVVASFLAKDLLLDWRIGEHYFMTQLIDGDFASNNGGWGFCSSAGVDPQPYFRIFNPYTQSKKFDVMGTYIKKWVPELRTLSGDALHDAGARLGKKEIERLGYVMPIVDHAVARNKALERYKAGLGRDRP